MDTILETAIGYPDEIPQTLFRYFLLYAIFKFFSLQDTNKGFFKRDEEDEDDDWDYIR
jgi:hypothetical protein